MVEVLVDWVALVEALLLRLCCVWRARAAGVQEQILACNDETIPELHEGPCGKQTRVNHLFLRVPKHVSTNDVRLQTCQEVLYSCIPERIPCVPNSKVTIDTWNQVRVRSSNTVPFQSIPKPPKQTQAAFFF